MKKLSAVRGACWVQQRCGNPGGRTAALAAVPAAAVPAAAAGDVGGADVRRSCSVAVAEAETAVLVEVAVAVAAMPAVTRHHQEVLGRRSAWSTQRSPFDTAANIPGGWTPQRRAATVPRCHAP